MVHHVDRIVIASVGGNVYKKPENQHNSIVLETSLQSFFFDQLLSENKKFQSPLPNESIYYSSLVMDKFGQSHEYFEVSEGRIREKVLGIKLMESTHLNTNEQKRALKDIGDTALLMCGFFSESINEKIVDYRYYKEVGQSAYARLDSFIPSFYDVNSFYKIFAKQFETITSLMQMVSKNQLDKQSAPVLLFANNFKIKAS